MYLELQHDRSVTRWQQKSKSEIQRISEAVGTLEFEKELLRIPNDNMKLIPKVESNVQCLVFP